MIHFHWALDKYTRIKSLLKDGWEFATAEDVEKLQRGQPPPSDRILMKATHEVWRMFPGSAL